MTSTISCLFDIVMSFLLTFVMFQKINYVTNFKNKNKLKLDYCRLLLILTPLANNYNLLPSLHMTNTIPYIYNTHFCYFNIELTLLSLN